MLISLNEQTNKGSEDLWVVVCTVHSDTLSCNSMQSPTMCLISIMVASSNDSSCVKLLGTCALTVPFQIRSHAQSSPSAICTLVFLPAPTGFSCLLIN